ncbi:NAD-binding protein [Aurantiacibacter rhizosphaerae]|uniref:Voltage-gated potassium channel n=1 Tax=Aurantiacibacter rhizosphaerae TaxID=2691582 RepID=A0A844XEX1_9SPHN|nr:NAD-binding protein [Aurantiacibacter rhizosphaerae]MWV29131.1 voltage-gated potassium channel [Aurantiacibacter rhizosphaerae]
MHLVKLKPMTAFARIREFSHLFIAAGVLVMGLVQLGSLWAELRTGGFTVDTLQKLPQLIETSLISGGNRMVSGVFMVIMAPGLAMRSRLAWVVVTLLTIIDIALWLSVSHTHFVFGALQIALLAALYLFRAQFSHTSIAAASIFSTGSLFLVVAYGVLGSLFMGSQFSTPINDLGTAFYFTIVTMSTVGYGDIYPTTPDARLYVISLILLGLTVFTAAISTVLLPFLQKRLQNFLAGKERAMKMSGHYVITSRSNLALNTCRELQERGESVMFIVETPGDDLPDDAQVVTGNPTDIETLKHASGKTARAIMALGEDDATNAFVVLAAKELQGSAQTVVAVNNTKNLAKVQRVQPDMVIAPTILGGELLAMALTGEEVSDQSLVDRLINPHASDRENAT